MGSQQKETALAGVAIGGTFFDDMSMVDERLMPTIGGVIRTETGDDSMRVPVAIALLRDAILDGSISPHHAHLLTHHAICAARDVLDRRGF
jgi:hypothetical protein